MSLSEAILDAFGDKFGALKLIPADGGRFEITVGGDLVYSKLKTGDFPENKAILEQIKARL